jgi:hypothetical protein
VSLPPPDVPYEVPQLVSVTDVRIYVVGYTHEDPDVEVLAKSGGDDYRFYLPKHARVVRDFWKSIGVTNVLKLQAGAYEDTRGGCGPYSMTAMAIGEDYPTPGMPPPEEVVDEPVAWEEDAPLPVIIRGTKVLISVSLEG